MCKLPYKPNNSGTIELYSKKEMKAGVMIKGVRMVIPSPNLADDVMMSFDNGSQINVVGANFVMPQPIRPQGRR